MKPKIYLPFIFLVLLSLTALAGNFNASIGRGYETLQLENSAGYKDKTNTLLYSTTIDWTLSSNFGVLLNFENGSTKSAEIDTNHSYPLEALKGHYNRQILAVNYYLGKDTLRLGLGLGFDIDKEAFTWIGDNDETIDRIWEWNRSSLGVSSLVSLIYQGSRLGLRGRMSYTPLFKSKETLVGAKDDLWESWKMKSVNATLLKLNGEATLSISKSLGVLGGITYRNYQSPKVNVKAHYENSDGVEEEVDSIASKVLEKGSFVYLGIKITL